MSRRHNDANVLCLSASHPPEEARRIVEAFLAARRAKRHGSQE